MPPRQKSLTRGGWKAFALSALLHATIVVVAVLAWKYWKRGPEPVQTLAIDATLVDESALKPAKPASNPEPPPPEPVPVPEPEPAPPPEEQGPPKPDPAEIEREQEEQKQKEEQQKRDADQKQEQLRLDAEKKRLETEKEREAEKKAAAKAAADKAAADKKRADDAAAKKRADDAEAKRVADEKARQAREAELRRSLEAEERGRALQNSDAANRWHAAIVARIQRAWIRPPSAQPGISCTVLVTQVPGGEVTSVRVDSCSGGDAALRESVEAAVLRASPLPSPPDPALFERNLELTFAPTT
jgi:colicin import membrane protein